MKTKKNIFKIFFIIIAILAALTAIIYVMFICAPYLLMIMAFPTWLCAALAAGAKV